jgi:hypothetical protein
MPRKRKDEGFTFRLGEGKTRPASWPSTLASCFGAPLLIASPSGTKQTPSSPTLSEMVLLKPSTPANTRNC